MLDNSTLVAKFCPADADGDTFIYTEMLDRGKKKGNNGQRLLKTFYHRSVAEFWEQWPTIQKLCDMSLVRACTRLAPRSYKRVGREFTNLVVNAALTDNWAGMKTLYNRACGIVSPNEKLWLFDVDVVPGVDLLRIEVFGRWLTDRGHLRARIPSKKGYHLITRPFNPGEWSITAGNADGFPVDFHKDNPTNLYIPDGAD